MENYFSFFSPNWAQNASSSVRQSLLRASRQVKPKKKEDLWKTQWDQKLYEVTFKCLHSPTNSQDISQNITSQHNKHSKISCIGRIQIWLHKGLEPILCFFLSVQKKQSCSGGTNSPWFIYTFLYMLEKVLHSRNTSYSLFKEVM